MQHQPVKGGILIQVLLFMTIGIFVISGSVNWGVMSVRLARQGEIKEQAMQIAEAGIDYYRWHLAHDPADFQDGTGAPGPYIHDYFDKSGAKIGEFALTIDPPPLGSTIVTITSTGTSMMGTTTKRAVRTRIGKPSYAKFAVLSNSDLSIGATIVGPMHSNGLLYMVDGTAQNLMTSSKTTASSSMTGGVVKWGVYAATDPNPPTGLATVTSMFLVGRDIGVPGVDFSDLTVDLAQLETSAVTNGRYYGDSGALGYHIVLHTDDTYTITRVDTFATGGGSCGARQWWNSCAVVANGAWRIGTQSAIAGGTNVPFPTNGIIYAEDDVWVDGTINTARLTIVAATMPDVGPRRNIIVNNDLLYTNKDGQDAIGLIAQDNFWIGVVSEEDLEIDAAIIAQNGRVSRHGYNNCGTHSEKNNLYMYGMFASNQRYAYGNLDCNSFGNSGYQNSRTYEYDTYLLYGPPPSFPLTSAQYEILSSELAMRLPPTSYLLSLSVIMLVDETYSWQLENVP